MGPAAGGEDGQGKGWNEGEESLFHSDAQWKKIKVSMLCKDTLFSAHSLLSPPVCRVRLQDLKKRLIFADMIRILLSWALLLAAAIPTPRAHPRLLLPAGEEETVRARIAEEPEVALADSLILAACEKMMAQPPVVREKIGKRLLHVSREALKRIFYLSYAWRIHAGEDAAGRARRDAYADRAIREMMAVCRFSDWNPTHFLDVGEMTMAVAIGYDWLYPVMTEDQRDSVAAAVRKLAFDASRNEKDAWFYNNTNNWNQVCNAGLSCGAIALFEQFPDEARAILAKCLETNPKALDDYSPEGGYPEGYAYWAYGSAYQILLLASLESAARRVPVHAGLPRTGQRRPHAAEDGDRPVPPVPREDDHQRRPDVPLLPDRDGPLPGRAERHPGPGRAHVCMRRDDSHADLSQRMEIPERHLPGGQGRPLDVQSRPLRPGFLLLRGRRRRLGDGYRDAGL